MSDLIRLRRSGQGVYMMFLPRWVEQYTLIQGKSLWDIVVEIPRRYPYEDWRFVFDSDASGLRLVCRETKGARIRSNADVDITVTVPKRLLMEGFDLTIDRS